MLGSGARIEFLIRALRRTTWLSIALGPFWLLRCPPSRAISPKQESVPFLPAPASACRRAIARQWSRRHATVAAVRRSARVGADASQSARSRANETGALLHFCSATDNDLKDILDFFFAHCVKFQVSTCAKWKQIPFRSRWGKKKRVVVSCARSLLPVCGNVCCKFRFQHLVVAESSLLS